MSAIVERLLIGYGSESGNARTLARRLSADPALQAYAPRATPLDEIAPEALDAHEALIVVSSSFGDGEPPGNAEIFLARAREAPRLEDLRYAVFGLGDTAYPQFCGFTKGLDALLTERGARPLVNRVDADAGYEEFFRLWTPTLGKVLQGDAQAGRDLHLRVKAYGEADAYAAPILERRQLDKDAPGAWLLRLDISGSGMSCQAGDNLHLMPENDAALLEALAHWLGAPEAVEALRRRELRQIGKGLLRDLAKLSGSEALKGLLKIGRRKELEDYLWGADLLDVLEDFCAPGSVSLADLEGMLSPCLPRAYSIASAGGSEEVELCVRDIAYERGGRLRRGAATGWMLSHEGPLRVFCRSNPGFHLPREAPGEAPAPLILIGAGTGLAPLMGLLRETRLRGPRRETCLIFGEKRRARDFLHEAELREMQAEGVLTHLLPAFSRDGAAKYYVQHAVTDHAPLLRGMLERGAHVHLCGDKSHLERGVSEAFDAARGGIWRDLEQAGRLHRELY
ncbi:sulfite reductase flavoprotein subunit alpha [Neomegalonema sp.]|uniref:sulfite reductase flavoprotein subunit alpha n=1 Tax=Neomegalonema sp. TaxID=2039713 RepID=UPI0026392FE0|nr:sulfite reductase flavoprotein subunit alpha [Neomegalonema sp.]MDD2869331.1 sulfite reductase flavoprotein subunit alpha [Neomegalonema sp.]